MKNIKTQFPWFKNNPSYTYLDSAATSLKPTVVIQAVSNYYSFLSTNPHNSDSDFTYKLTSQIADCRHELAKLLQAQDDEIIFTSGATESLSLFANAIKKMLEAGDEIVLPLTEHTSNIIPWFEIKKEKNIKLVWAQNQANSFYVTENDIINAITKKTKVVSFSSISNLYAQWLDPYLLAKKIKKINKEIIIVVDITQSLPHFKFDTSCKLFDFAAFSGHKMLGPTGIGGAYINSKWTNIISPLKFGGSMNNIVTTEEYTFADGVARFEGGTPNSSGIIGWKAAIDFLNKLGWDKIAAHDQKILVYLKQQLKTVDNLIYYNQDAKLPIAAFNLKNVNSQDLAIFLGGQKIIVRSGLSCAKVSVCATKIPAVVRASFYLYNTKEDVDTLIRALKKYQKGDELNGII